MGPAVGSQEPLNSDHADGVSHQAASQEVGRRDCGCTGDPGTAPDGQEGDGEQCGNFAKDRGDGGPVDRARRPEAEEEGQRYRCAGEDEEGVAGEVERANDGIQEINEATDDQAASTEEVVSMVDEVASVSDQTSTEAQNSSAAAEEQTSSLTEVSENVQSLAQRADELQDMLDEFTVGGQAPGMATSPDDGAASATTDGGRAPDRREDPTGR